MTSEKYVIAIDQSTQGTKSLLFDATGKLLSRQDVSHRQLINEQGWVSHNPMEIYDNTILAVKMLLEETGIDRSLIGCVGISNQRETALAWNRCSGEPLGQAIVWQCKRGEDICRRLQQQGLEETVRERTGLKLSPFFSAAKLSWLMENEVIAKRLGEENNLCCGTIDSWLVYMLTGKKEFRTDYSNASRTQLFNIKTLKWDEELCRYFNVPQSSLPKVTDSDGMFGVTDFAGLLPAPIPIHGVVGDSHGALYGQGCLDKGMLKVTYGTGSSVMMNIGEQMILSDQGLVTSLAWKMQGRVQYVLEGNINYAGAVVTWMKESLEFVADAKESQELAKQANAMDKTYLVPAFSGMGAPYWRSDVSAAFIGMSRTTKKAELVRAGLSSIAYQIADVIFIMQAEAQVNDIQLRVDGGPTSNHWLMQFQSDIVNSPVVVPDTQEASGMGAAYMAGMGAGIYKSPPAGIHNKGMFCPRMPKAEQAEKYSGWKNAVATILQ